MTMRAASGGERLEWLLRHAPRLARTNRRFLLEGEKMTDKAMQMIQEAGSEMAQRFEEYYDSIRPACNSPIEEILLAALMAYTAHPVFVEWHFLGNTRVDWGWRYSRDYTAYVHQQAKVGDYRADFLIVDCSVPFELAKPRFMVVECDGHEFHEKTKEQAKRDKKRDRFFQSRGIKVLRFTGSEIFSDPEAVAAEIVGELQCDDDWRSRKSDTPQI